jgi:hypothetical protein
MMAAMGKLGLFALVLCAGACGGGADIEGTWQVTHHTENTAACDVEGTAQTDVAAMRFSKQDFFGTEFLQVELCGDLTPTSCGSPGRPYLFAEEIDSGYRAQFSEAAGGGEFGDCVLGFGFATAVRTDDTLRLEMTSYAETVAGLSADACNTDEAASRGDGMPCEKYEVLEGTWVEENP